LSTITGVGTAGISSIPTRQWIDHKVEMTIDDNSNLLFNLHINGSKLGTIKDSTPSLVNGGAVGIRIGSSDGNKANGNTAYIQCYTDEVTIKY
jgi:hypothetical protein